MMRKKKIKNLNFVIFFLVFFIWGIEFSVFLSGFCVFIVTAVDSGSKALEFLGIHDEQGTSPSGSSESQVIGGGNLLRSWVINSE